MLANISEEFLLGAKTPAEFSTNLASLIEEHKKLKLSMSEIDISALTKRIEALEKLTPLSEARVKELVASDGKLAAKEFIVSDEGKKLVGAEASRITMEAMAATGTVPVKQSPAPVVNVDDAKNLIAQQKYAEAWAISKELQAEFPDAKCFAAYAKAEADGRVLIGTSKTL